MSKYFKSVGLDECGVEGVLVEKARAKGYTAFRQPNITRVDVDGSATYALVYPKGTRPKDCNPQGAAVAFRIHGNKFQWCWNKDGYRLDPAHEIVLPNPGFELLFDKLLGSIG